MLSVANMDKFSLPALAGILLSSLALSAPAPDAEFEETAAPVIADTMDIKAYRDIVADIETDLGA